MLHWHTSILALAVSNASQLLDVLDKAYKQDEALAGNQSPSVSVNQQGVTLSAPVPESAAKKPWLRNGECQFKVCGRCRPSFRERSYLSLDAIVNGDIPATAVAGFGFNLLVNRPVASAELMKSIGLRPSPPPVSARWRGDNCQKYYHDAWKTLAAGAEIIARNITTMLGRL